MGNNHSSEVKKVIVVEPIPTVRNDSTQVPQAVVITKT